MNKEFFEGSWHELKGKIKEKWGKLTDDDLLRIDGSWERMLGSLEKNYGYKKDQAEKELSKWKNESTHLGR
ncbi:UPF0337 protein YjbJ [Neochlamydia sp. EPS4]|jgi:uncharacterized protein YjbJ (UPF0337 family)|uniref:CsbD family protein n=1 Tax=unclassified Neochlamydia TaxID=2643326 RepID=UPI000583489A|nr:MULTISPECIES: CsbD family protein [unclassified Neochlamydia]KIC74635.1 UPF0337 protein YjbJ [Neochlamydia sp. EPS4]MBS4165842.1 UPF0337 protein YjbJ [Neochlamydia sp. AcF65]MBS4171305.1 UPF0337 protein YjbJ [Neochlamydia sp. AcF95]NGY94805.1 UPF0337 protein YjbJ [Neochlamydia sp. AcF84]